MNKYKTAQNKKKNMFFFIDTNKLNVMVCKCWDCAFS